MVDVEKRGANAFAHLIRQWTSAIFRYGVATLRAENDPSAALRGAVIRNKVRHAKALSRDQIKSLLEAINVYRGEPATLFGLQLMLLTFVRTIEMRGARWDEINFKKSEWRIPADRMKMREEHIVPLSKQAVAILKALYTINGHRDFLFPNRRNPKTFITSTTLNRALERMGFLGDGSIGFSAHGFRATASTMLNEAGFRSDVIERQLAHQERNGVRASYNHATYMEERRVMMQVWADTVDDMRKETSSNQISFVRALPSGNLYAFSAFLAAWIAELVSGMTASKVIPAYSKNIRVFWQGKKCNMPILFELIPTSVDAGGLSE